MLKTLLAHPMTRGLSIDDPRTTDLRRSIVRDKPFLRKIYEEWYAEISANIPNGQGDVLELGSGAGFLDEYIPSLITSEVFSCGNIRLVADATNMPLKAGALRAIAMTDVFHHIPDSRSFLREALRCLRPGGVVVMIEPWVSSWSKLIYKNLHHEPFEPGATDWTVPNDGPLSGANGALPWIVFQRDRTQLEAEFPQLQVQTIKPMMPFRYLVSGGVSMRTLMPGASVPLWRAMENFVSPWMESLAMFAMVVVRKREEAA